MLYTCVFIGGREFLSANGVFKSLCNCLIFISIAFLLPLLYKGTGYDDVDKSYGMAAPVILSIFMIFAIKRSNKHKGISFIKLIPIIERCSFLCFIIIYIFWNMKTSGGDFTNVIIAYLFSLMVGIGMHFIVDRYTEKLREYMFSDKLK